VYEISRRKRLTPVPESAGRTVRQDPNSPTMTPGRNPEVPELPDDAPKGLMTLPAAVFEIETDQGFSHGAMMPGSDHNSAPKRVRTPTGIIIVAGTGMLTSAERNICTTAHYRQAMSPSWFSRRPPRRQGALPPP